MMRNPRERLAVCAGACAMSLGILVGAGEERALAASAHGGDVVTAIVNVSVLPMDREAILPRHTVLVRRDRIIAVGPAQLVQPPAGAMIIDGVGLHLLPAYADMHSHLASLHTGQLTRELLDQMLLLYLLNGVTTVRGMASGLSHLEIRERVRSGESLGPTILVASPALGRNNARDPREAARLVAAHAAAGFDMIKIHGGFGRESYDAIMAAARRHGISVAGHVDQEAGLEHTLATRQSTIEHLDGFIQAVVTPAARARATGGELSWEAAHDFIDAARVRAIAEQTRDAAVWSVPTLYVGELLAGSESGEELAALHPELEYVPAELRRIWIEYAAGVRDAQTRSESDEASRLKRAEARRGFLRALNDAGAPIMLGTDAPTPFVVPGFSMRREMELMARSGLTAFQVLESATRNPGRYVAEVLGQDGSFGTIAVGNRADLVLVRGNPLEDIANSGNVTGVLVRGRWFTAADLRSRIRALGEPAVHP